MDYDVAIVGYGPTGMALAALLGRDGHRVAVIERYAGLYNLPRAACFDDEVMRTFQKLGIDGEIGRGASVQRGYQWMNASGEVLVDFTYDNPARCGWAALYMMFQPHVEAVLDRLDRTLPSVDILQGVTVDAIEQDRDGVHVRGTRGDGAAVGVRARYVVGADGGNGFTRRTFGTRIDDYGFQENWLVCDFRLVRDPGLPTFRQVCDPAQPTSIVNIGPGYHRFSFMLEPNETAEQATQAEGVWSRVARYLAREDAELIRAANYVFRSRIVETWRHGRVFLAGDAAHEMPPFLAQGMCSGIRDSHNLAWKLDLVLKGLADEALLDSYQAEREPHVRAITEKAIELGRVQTTRDLAKAKERDERLLARRRADQGPDKLAFPGLTAGLVANGGDIFPQFVVSHGGETGLLDGFVQPGWLLVVADAAMKDALTALHLIGFEAIGGRVVAVTADGAGGSLRDEAGRYGAWFAERGCAAAIMRPDFYLYGTAGDDGELAALLDRLARSLAPHHAEIAA